MHALSTEQAGSFGHNIKETLPSLYESRIEQGDSRYRKKESNADSLYSKTFMRPVTSDDPGIHGDFFGSFNIFGPGSLNVFQPTAETSVLEPMSTTFQGKMKIFPDKGIDVTFNIPAHAVIPRLPSNAQSSDKGPCEVTLQVRLPQNYVSPAASDGKVPSRLRLS